MLRLPVLLLNTSLNVVSFITISMHIYVNLYSARLISDNSMNGQCIYAAGNAEWDQTSAMTNATGATIYNRLRILLRSPASLAGELHDWVSRDIEI